MNVLQIKRYSPKELVGIRDEGALEMLIEAPKATAFGEEVYPTISEKTGILLIHLVKKHVFQNANKRTSFMAMYVFLNMNGWTLNFTNEEAVAFVVDIATDQGDFDELKKWVCDEIESHLTVK